MCDATPRAGVTLRSGPEAARTARQFLREAHCPRHNEEALEVAVLLVSELVTNAVRHGRPPVRVEIDCRSDAALEVGVTDSGPALALRPTRPIDDAEGGRGLAIVDVLADAWGIEPVARAATDHAGKTVWFRIDRHESLDLRDQQGSGAPR